MFYIYKKHTYFSVPHDGFVGSRIEQESISHPPSTKKYWQQISENLEGIDEQWLKKVHYIGGEIWLELKHTLPEFVGLCVAW